MCNESAATASAPLRYRIEGGLATLGPAMLELRSELDETFVGWAGEIGARSMVFPALLPASYLESIDYFRNFPHLALAASRIRPEVLKERYAAGREVRRIEAEDLEGADYVLPSAACYNVYRHLHGTKLEEARYITTIATCFRNEEAYDDLRRLWSFTMREIVCVGTAETVKAMLGGFKEKLRAYFGALDLDVELQFATDPFYEPQSSTARLQKLFPQKEECVYGGSLAIASLNFHRNFFGERCDIRLPDGSPAFTGCTAFGLERWLWALLDRYEQSPEQALEAARRARGVI